MRLRWRVSGTLLKHHWSRYTTPVTNASSRSVTDFEDLFNPNEIHEVDVPGLTSLDLASFGWQYLPRPVFPLDKEAACSIDQA